MNTNNEIVVEQLIALITQANAHVTFDESVANISFHNLSVKPNNLPYNIWQLVEHIRIAQWDILEFSRNAHHTSPKWPDEYWPNESSPANEDAWQRTL
ncbi:MAG TPA: DinB family protein, partial [Flavisolibacter sp.]|nr:DinB family protein [Flavisolibacter sp.]